MQSGVYGEQRHSLTTRKRGAVTEHCCEMAADAVQINAIDTINMAALGVWRRQSLIEYLV